MLPESFWFRTLFQTGLSPITILDIILLFVFLCVSRINSLFVFFLFCKKGNCYHACNSLSRYRSGIKRRVCAKFPALVSRRSSIRRLQTLQPFSHRSFLESLFKNVVARLVRADGFIGFNSVSIRSAIPCLQGSSWQLLPAATTAAAVPEKPRHHIKCYSKRFRQNCLVRTQFNRLRHLHRECKECVHFWASSARHRRIRSVRSHRNH